MAMYTIIYENVLFLMNQNKIKIKFDLTNSHNIQLNDFAFIK